MTLIQPPVTVHGQPVAVQLRENDPAEAGCKERKDKELEVKVY